MRSQLRVLGQAAIAGWAEFTAFYTWQTWTFTWLARLLVQVSFYALIGRMLDDQQRVAFLVVGNAVAVVAIDAAVVVLLTIVERRSGTLPLLVAAPSTHLTIYLGRGLNHLVSGIAASIIAFFGLCPLFGVALPWPRALAVMPMIGITGLACYAYAASIASIVLGFPSARWVALNVSYLLLMTFCGVSVPVSYWPEWAQRLTTVLPLSHGLAAIRLLLAGGSAAAILTKSGAEMAVSLGWFVVAAAGFRGMVSRGRRDGSIDFGA